MRVLKMEIVIGAVEIGRHDGYIVCAVLEIVRLTHLQASNLRDGILLIGVLEGRGEETILCHRLRGILRIDTCAAKEEELPDTMGVSLRDDITLYRHVHHDEVGTVKGIGHDATDKGSGKDNSVRTLLIEEAAHGKLVGKVKLRMAAADKILIATREKVVPDGRANKATVAGNINLTVLI